MEPSIMADSNGTYSVAIGEWVLIARATLEQARALVRDIRIVKHGEGKVSHGRTC